MAIFLPQLARLAAETFVAGLWQGLVLIAAVALALSLVSRIPASIRFVIWSRHLCPRRGSASAASPRTRRSDPPLAFGRLSYLA